MRSGSCECIRWQSTPLSELFPARPAAWLPLKALLHVHLSMHRYTFELPESPPTTPFPLVPSHPLPLTSLNRQMAAAWLPSAAIVPSSTWPDSMAASKKQSSFCLRDSKVGGDRVSDQELVHCDSPPGRQRPPVQQAAHMGGRWQMADGWRITVQSLEPKPFPTPPLPYHPFSGRHPPPSPVVLLVAAARLQQHVEGEGGGSVRQRVPRAIQVRQHLAGAEASGAEGNGWDSELA